MHRLNRSNKLTKPAEDWLRRFAECVRARTYDQARPLFHSHVYSFGTVAYAANGLDDLVSHQWREVWDATEGFDFSYQNAHCWQDGELICVAVSWDSRGVDPNGKVFERRGRSTLVLMSDSGEWRAVHSHFSMEPGPNPSS